MAQATRTQQAIGELLLAGTIAAGDFTTFIRAYSSTFLRSAPSGAPTLMLLESQPRLVIEEDARQDLLLFAYLDPGFDFTPYTSGRIFHALGELRWERQHSGVQMLYTGHKEYQPRLPDARATDLNTSIPKDRSYFLFGKRLDEQQLGRIGPSARPGDFAEVRIPRLLRYPALPALAKAERVQLVICEYEDADTGVTVAYRFKQLVPFSKPAEIEERNGR